MEQSELTDICRLILVTVENWLRRQDGLTRAVHEIAVDVVQIGGEAPVSFVLHNLHEHYQQCWPEDYCCDLTVAFRVAEILNTELKHLSILFNNLYRQFNVRYFGASLPNYRVKVMHSLSQPVPPFTREEGCACAVRPGEILLEYNGWPEVMISRLVHDMAHVKAGPEHGAEWERTMNTALGLGAPCSDEVADLATWDTATPVEKS